MFFEAFQYRKAFLCVQEQWRRCWLQARRWSRYKLGATPDTFAKTSPFPQALRAASLFHTNYYLAAACSTCACDRTALINVCLKPSNRNIAYTFTFRKQVASTQAQITYNADLTLTWTSSRVPFELISHRRLASVSSRKQYRPRYAKYPASRSQRTSLMARSHHSRPCRALCQYRRA